MKTMNAVFKQSYTLKLFITFKLASSCCFSIGENLDFPEFLKKSFITLITEPSTEALNRWVVYLGSYLLAVWPGLAKFRKFSKNLEIFGTISKVYLIFGKVVNSLWDFLYDFGQNFNIVNGQMLKIQSGHLVTLPTGHPIATLEVGKEQSN